MKNMKRTLAAALCLAMLGSCMPFGALAEAVNQGEKPLVELIVPVAAVEKSEPLVEKIEPKAEKVAPVLEKIEKIEPAAEKIEKIAPVIEKIEKIESAAEKIEKIAPVIEKIEKIEPVVEKVEKIEPVTEKIEPAVEKTEKIEPVTPPSVVEPVTPPAAPQETVPVYSEIGASVETDEDYIKVTITGGSSEAMYVYVGDDVRTDLHKGDSATFTGLAAGEYEIEIDYMNGTNVFRTTVEVEGKTVAEPVTPPAVAEPVTPPAVVEPVTPPAVAEPVTPPPVADPVIPPVEVDPVAPPAGGGVELITPPPSSGNTQDPVKAFTILPVVTGSSISVVVDGASSREVEIVVLDQNGKQVAANAIIGSGLVQLGSFAAGPYTVRAQYVTPVQDQDGHFDYMTVTAGAVVIQGQAGGAEPQKPVSIEAKVETTTDSIVVTVTKAANAEMLISVSGQPDKGIYTGSSVRYDGLTPGKTYEIEIDYKTVVEGTTPFRTSVTLPKEKYYPTFERGDRGDKLIYDLQQRLKDLGYYTIKVDGIYGSGTQRAVRMFQQENGLKVTGIADSATQNLLYSSAARPAGSSSSGSYKTLQRSSKYKSAVVPLQRRLKALGYYTGNIDGYFGSATYRAVRNFQSRNGLKVTGVADPYTQEVLHSSYAKKASGSSSSSSAGYRLLYWGCRGDAVRRLQQALVDAGYKSIVRAVDGIFGQWTYDAVRAYQKDHRLAVDGIAGKNTQNSLYGTSY